MTLRIWILALLFTLFLSAVGIGMFSSGTPFSSASVLVFLSAVIGLDTTSVASTLVSRQSGHEVSSGPSPSAGATLVLQQSPAAKP